MTDHSGGDRRIHAETPGPSLGVFPGDEYEVRHVQAVDEWLGGALEVVVTFVHAGLPPERRERFVDDVLTPMWEAGYTPLLTWEPFSLDPDAGASPATQVREKGLLRAWAETLAEWVAAGGGGQRTLIMRPAHEMNGSWYPWSAGEGVTAPEYVELWNALVDGFDDHGQPADTVSWVWCANAESTSEVTLSDYYPGDGLVDWVGVDGYNWGSSRPWSEWRLPADVFGPAFETIRGFSDRPLVVPEVGCSSAADTGTGAARKSAWIDAAFDYFAAEEVQFVGWFDADKETDWAVCSQSGTGMQSERTRQGRAYGVYPSFKQSAARYIGKIQRND